MKRSVLLAANSVLVAVLAAGCANSRGERLDPWSHVEAHQHRDFSFRDEHFPDRTDTVMRYLLLGRDDAPITAVFVHGVTSDKLSWKYASQAFANDFQLALVDLPGHGDSAKDFTAVRRRIDEATEQKLIAGLPVDLDRVKPVHPYTMKSQARVFKQFLLEAEGLKDRPLVLFGLSQGGGIVLETLRLMSPKERRRIAACVLIAPAAHFYPMPDGFRENRYGHDHTRLLCKLPGNGFEGLVRSCLESKFVQRNECFYGPERVPSWIKEELIDFYSKTFSSDDSGLHVKRLIATDTWIELAAREAAGEDQGRYSDLDMPALLIWGAHDSIVRLGVLHRLLAELPQADPYVILDAGHGVHIEWQNAVVDRIHKFLRNENVITAHAR